MNRLPQAAEGLGNSEFRPGLSRSGASRGQTVGRLCKKSPGNLLSHCMRRETKRRGRVEAVIWAEQPEEQNFLHQQGKRRTAILFGTFEMPSRYPSRNAGSG